MIKQLEDIYRDVRVCMDRNRVSNSFLSTDDVDTLSVDELIGSKVLEGVRRVESSAPAYLLDGGHHFGETVYWTDLASGWVLLPEDFMRLVVFEMDDWERAVFTAESAEDPTYRFQQSRHKGVRGTSERPVCFITIRPEGRALEFYSCRTTDARVSRAVYLPYPKIDEYGGVDICSRCYDAVVYTIAGLVSSAIGEQERAGMFNELAKGCLI